MIDGVDVTDNEVNPVNPVNTRAHPGGMGGVYPMSETTGSAQYGACGSCEALVASIGMQETPIPTKPRP